MFLSLMQALIVILPLLPSEDLGLLFMGGRGVVAQSWKFWRPYSRFVEVWSGNDEGVSFSQIPAFFILVDFPIYI